MGSLDSQVQRDIEEEFYRILDEAPSKRAVEFAVNDLIETSDFVRNRYSPDDVVLAVRRTLVKAVELLNTYEDILQLVRKLEEENAHLRKRVQHLETVVHNLLRPPRYAGRND